MPKQVSATETLSRDRLKARFEVEKALASKLRRADRAGRMRLYRDSYNDLFRAIEDHAQLTRKVDAQCPCGMAMRRHSRRGE